MFNLIKQEHVIAFETAITWYDWCVMEQGWRFHSFTGRMVFSQTTLRRTMVPLDANWYCLGKQEDFFFFNVSIIIIIFTLQYCIGLGLENRRF